MGREPRGPEALTMLFCILLIPLVALPAIKWFRPPDAVEAVPQPLGQPTLPPGPMTDAMAAMLAELKKPWKWSGEIKPGPKGLTTYLGLAPPDNPRHKQMNAAAPWILCQMIKRYPRSALQVEWATGLDGTSGSDFSLSYNREKETLSEMAFGFGGGHGVNYSGVTNELLLQLEQEARRSKSKHIDLRRLTHLGCSAKSF